MSSDCETPGFRCGDAAVQGEVSAVERRKRTRFVLELDCKYSATYRRRIVAKGFGRTLDISRYAVRFDARRFLPVGVTITLTMSWPAPLEDGHSIQLVVRGPVLRSKGVMAVIALDKYEFRTAPHGPAGFNIEKAEHRPGNGNGTALWHRSN